MEELLKTIQDFRIKKGWHLSDTPHVLAKSTLVEAAELLECFLEENPQDEAVQSELADVLMYALSLAMDKGWNVQTMIEKKLLDVDTRYPDIP